MITPDLIGTLSIVMLKALQPPRGNHLRTEDLKRKKKAFHLF
jgi:hypothetical protein